MSEVSQESANNDEAVSHLLFRPTDAFQSIPPAYHWEFTRRHPYYLLYWKLAREYRSEPSADEADRNLQHVASLMLTAVNVAPSVLPPDPRDEISELGYGSIAGGWESGAVAPATLRTLAHMLLLALPKVQRSQLGRLLNESAEFESADKERMPEIHEGLDRLPGEEWNSFPVAPIVSINLQSSQRAISDAIETLVSRWKVERNITEIRRRDDKLAEYLEVWDLREGWLAGAYDGTRDRKIREIAAQLQVPQTTVMNRYRSAFQKLTGYEYTPERYIQLFGVLKFSKPESFSQIARYRPWRGRNLRAVPEVDLLPDREQFNSREVLANAAATDCGNIMVDLRLDVTTLIERGLTDNQIRDELFPEHGTDNLALLELIGALRARQEDSL